MKVLNFGSLNIDRVYQVPHFVSAGETLLSTEYALFPGGKGLNQSIALARAGLDVYHAGKIGEDGAFLKALLAENHVNTDHIFSENGATGHAIIQVDKAGQNCILLFGGTNQTITCEEIDQVLSCFMRGDYIVLQNEISNLDYIFDSAIKRGLRIVLNPSPYTPALLDYDLSAVDVLMLNEVEGKMMTGQSSEDCIMDALIARFKNAVIVLTLGPDGSICYDRERIHRFGTYEVPIVDTTAAGDTFTGFFLEAYISTADCAHALKMASAAASIAVGNAGAAKSIPYKENVIAFLTKIE